MDHEPQAYEPQAVPPQRESSTDLERELRQLQARKQEWATLPIGEKIRLLEVATRRLGKHAAAWVQAASRAKRIEPGSPWVGEEWASGPWVVAASLTGYRRTLVLLAQGRLPAFERMRTTANGRLAVQVFPATLDERLILNGITAEVWMQPGVTSENLTSHMASFYREAQHEGKVALVLGAGNISAIAPLDAMHRLFVRGHVVLMKVSPVLNYLGPVMEEVFEPFVRRGYMRFAYGGADVGTYLCYHDGVDEIHLTGSIRTYDDIVYGEGAEGDARRQRGDTILKKPMTAELGGAGPVVVAPGPWSDKDLRYQAENVVTMKIQNGGFNCVAAQVLITPHDWPLRERFLTALRDVMRELPERYAYYPGAADHWKTVREQHPRAETFAGDVPLTLLPDLNPRDAKESAFATEFFGPVLGETALPGNDAGTFLENAVTFCNEILLGNLGANLVIHPKTIRELGGRFDTLLGDLRYGAIGVNIWDAAPFLLAESTWGPYPEPGRRRRASGNGVVRNSYMFDRPEKSVTYGSFYPFPRSFLHGSPTIMPKPPWFVTNKTAAETVERIVQFSVRPRYRMLPAMFLSALRG